MSIHLYKHNEDAYRAGLTLGAWINTQRRVKSGNISGNLTWEKIQKLNDIGMIWDVTDSSWQEVIEELKCYRNTYGNLDIKAKYVSPTGFRLGSWINNMRFKVKKYGISYCVKGLKNNRTKLITHSHNGKADNWKGSLTNKLIKKYTTKRSAYRLACSDLAYSYLFSDSMSGKWFVPNGVEIDRFKFNEVERRIIRVQNNISKDNIVIGNVGRFSAQKNHRYFLDLAEKLDNKFVFLLLGNGELKEEFIEKVKECGLEDKFRVVSAKTDVERYYSAMDVFVMPSIFEGLPITAIEAQCNGLPCVFSTYITQQVKLSSNCEFVDLEDKGKWIEVISNFSKSRYDGVKVITDNKFDIDSTVKMMEMIFEEL